MSSLAFFSDLKKPYALRDVLIAASSSWTEPETAPMAVTGSITIRDSLAYISGARMRC